VLTRNHKIESSFMLAHIRANLLLLGLTLLLCCVLYPLALWGIGQTVFPSQANGSLIFDKDGKPIASRLIAHEVRGEQYFQPRPSATAGNAWNAAASGASNWAANNYQLRDRVARSLAPVVKYKNGARHGQAVAGDVVKWFRDEQPALVADWANAHPTLAQNWVKYDAVTKKFVQQWFRAHPVELAAWKRENPRKSDPEPEDLAVAFFTSFSFQHPATWLAVIEEEGSKRVVLVGKNAAEPADIASVFFDMWRAAHPDVALDDVPADQVTASGSGLDPHITLKNARYQLPRVAEKWGELTGKDAARLRDEIDALLEQHAYAPLRGLAGLPMVNVVEVNVELHNRYAGKGRK
jgi:K+-transporting ATPase ATPase C chain